MNTPSQTPQTTPSPARDATDFADWVFARLKKTLFFAGSGMIAVGAVAAAAGIDSPSSNSAIVLGLASCGLAIAGGLCFVAVAILHSQESRNPEKSPPTDSGPGG